MSTNEAAHEFLATDAEFRALKARHDAATKVLRAWFDEHPDARKYRGLIACDRQGPWLALDDVLAKKTLGDQLASCLVDRYRVVLTPLKGT